MEILTFYTLKIKNIDYLIIVIISCGAQAFCDTLAC